MKVVTIVQARTGSNRLPGKALLALCGQPLVLHVLQRARAIGHETWLATTTADRDVPLANLAMSRDFPVYLGDERDVLGRMRAAAEAASAEVVVRVTGDCPLLAPDVAQAVVGLWIEAYAQHGMLKAGIATNDTATSGWPDGLDVEVFSADLLRQADRESPVPPDDMDARLADSLWRDREHVTPWMRRATTHRILPGPKERFGKVKLSVDDRDDFEHVRQVLAEVHGGGFAWADTVAALHRRRQKEKGR